MSATAAPSSRSILFLNRVLPPDEGANIGGLGGRLDPFGHDAGADVIVHDPKAIEPAKKRFPSLDFTENLEECLKGADLVLHLTEWKIYREMDPNEIKKIVKTPRIIDGRNMLNRDKWRAAGWDFKGLGRT